MRVSNNLMGLLLVGLVYGCGGSGSGSDNVDASASVSGDESIGIARAALWSRNGVQFWPGGNVRICLAPSITGDTSFMDGNGRRVEQLYKWVNEEIASFANITFEYPVACPNTLTPDLLVLIKGNDTEASVGYNTVLKTGYTAYNYIKFASASHFSSKRSVLHEFMHALGYSHEFERPDDPGTAPCSDPSGASSPSYWTPWDLYSMTASSYCHSLKRLSAWDRAGLSRSDNYGPRTGVSTFVASFSGVETSPTWTPWATVATKSVGAGTLTTSQILVGNFLDEVNVVGGGYTEDFATDDFLAATGSGWWLSSAGYGAWEQISTSGVSAASLLVGDFDGDAIDDILRPVGNTWNWCKSARCTSWATLNSLPYSPPKSELLVGSFDTFAGDDVLWISGGSTGCSNASPCQWYLSSGGSGSLTPVNSSSAQLIDMKVGDFNNDGRSDVFYGNGSTWRYSSGASTGWTQLALSTRKGREVLVANFDGLGSDDVFTSTNGKFKVSAEGTSDWVDVANSSFGIESLGVANFGLGRLEGGGKAKASVFRD